MRPVRTDHAPIERLFFDRVPEPGDGLDWTSSAPAAESNSSVATQTGPAVSPDGRALAYYARTGRGVKIYLQDLQDPDGWPRYFLPDEGQETSPSWSPDGRILAFARSQDIWVRPVSGGEPRRVIEDAYAGGNGSFVWSPDGTRMAFTKGASGFSQVGVVDVASGAVMPITYEPNEHGEIS